MNRRKKTLKARVAADLLLKVRAVEGWPKIEGDGVETIEKMKKAYVISTTRDNFIVATPRTDAEAAL